MSEVTGKYKLKVYSGTYLQAVAAGNPGNTQFELPNSVRQFKLKSLTFDVKLNETVSGLPLPLTMNNTQDFYLRMFQLPLTQQFTRSFDLIAGPVIVANGDSVTFFNPGQFIFDSFFCTDRLRFIFLYNNLAAVLSYTYILNVITEIEDIEVTA